MFGKTAVLKVSENYRENVFSSGSVVFLDVYDKHCGYQIFVFLLGVYGYLDISSRKILFLFLSFSASGNRKEIFAKFS